MRYFGVQGPHWGEVWNQEQKKERLPAKYSPIWEVILAPFRYFCGRIFECIFRCVHFPHFGRFWSPKVPKREILGGTLESILGVGPKGENRCFMYTGARF